MRKFLLILIGCFCIFSFSSAQAMAPKRWTFLIYINGNNSLDRFGKINIKQMEEVGSDDQVNVVVQWASLGTRETKRMLIQKSNDPTEVTSPVLENLGLVDMGDYHTLQEFIKWGITNFPAKHYFVDVWNHGSGWHFSKVLSGSSKIKPLNDISYDDISGNHITTEQLGQVMNGARHLIGHNIDIYGSDACLMAMAEVANEMSGSVNYFVGSQEIEPGMGWPYADFLKRWMSIPDATPKQVSKILVDAYVKSYQDGSSGKAEVTFSDLDLTKLTALNESVRALSDEIHNLNPKQRAKVLEIATETRSFAMHDYKDIIDFAKRLQTAGIKGLNSDVVRELEKQAVKVVAANASTKNFKDGNGISIWLPTSKEEFTGEIDRYHGLKFDTETQWGDALSVLLQGANETVLGHG